MYHVVMKNEKGDMVDNEELPRLFDATVMVTAMAGQLQVGWSISLKDLGDL